ncbi:hypothetical protein P7C70_g7074, partial [Phenoliferia sp. Uapishka_3]
MTTAAMMRPPLAVFMRPPSLLPPASSRPGPSATTPPTNPFVAQAHRIIRPSIPSPKYEVATISVEPAQHVPVASIPFPPPPTSYQASTIDQKDSLDDIPIQLHSNPLTSLNSSSRRLLKRSSAVSYASTKQRRHRLDLARQASSTSVSVYSHHTSDESPPSPQIQRQLSTQEKLFSARKRMGVNSPTTNPADDHSRSPSVRALAFPEPDPDTGTLERRSNDEILRHWSTFLSCGSPLVPSTSQAVSPAPSPAASTLGSPFQIHPSHLLPVRRFEALPRTSSLLRSRARRVLSPSPSLAAASATQLSDAIMARVDSEVLSARLALKRIGSTEFAGDALDKLGRNDDQEGRRKARCIEGEGPTLKEARWGSPRISSVCDYLRDTRCISSTATSRASSVGVTKAAAALTRSANRTSKLIEGLELDLQKLEQELNSRVEDQVDAEEEYVCAWDLLVVAEGSTPSEADPTNDSATPPIRDFLCDGAHLGTAPPRSRIPRPQSLVHLAGLPSPPPNVSAARRRSSIPVLVAARPKTVSVSIAVAKVGQKARNGQDVRKVAGPAKRRFVGNMKGITPTSGLGIQT